MAATINTTRAPTVDTLVFAERVYTVLRFDIANPIAAVIGAALIVALAWDKPGPAWAAGWAILILVAIALWVALLVAFRRAEPDAEIIGRWHQRALLCAAVSGALWGLAGMLCLLSTDLNLRIAVALVLISIVAAALPTLAALWHIFATFCGLALAIAALMILIAGGPAAPLIAAALIAAMALLLIIAYRHSSVLGSAFNLAFLNDLGMRQVNQKLEHIGNANTALTAQAAEYQRTRDELTRTKEAAEAATLAKSAFLANVSHEVRTPLHSIVGLANIALRDTPPETTQNYLVKILAAAHSLMGTVSSVLDFSKIESGQLVVDKTPFRMLDITENVQGIFSTLALEKGLSFQVAVDPGFPPRVIGDPVRIAQIMNNFVSNAIKYTDQGFVTLDVRAIEHTTDRVVAKIAVIDTGAGLSEAQQTALLGPLTRGPTAAPTTAVAGLGVAICQHLASSMGGHMGVDSEPGKGSRFWVEIPCGLPTEKEVAGTNTAKEESIDLTGLTVLLVEDNKLNQVVAGTLLEKQGVHIVIANNGQEAVDAILRDGTKFDAVLMDLDMPVMDGKAATLLIREKIPAAELPIIALTANALTTDMQTCLDIGMNAYLTKPIVPKDLFGAISRATRAVGNSAP
jgi:signal transduction histidine kinase/ActR/RegA family two-component response regulator